jgi:SAM-dependent methyltransferase
MLRNAVTPEMLELLETGTAGDLDFYGQYARLTGGPVLVLLCGIGRVAIPIATLGVPVIGLDADSAVIDLAKQRAMTANANRAMFVQGDPTHFVSDNKHPLILIPGGALQRLLTLEEQRACLVGARNALQIGGTLVLDLPILDLAQTKQIPAEIRRYGSTGDKVAVMRQQVQYDSPRQVLQTLIACEWLNTNGHVQSVQYGTTQTRHATPGEAILLLESCGFHVTVYGGFDRQDLVPGANRLVLEARRPR